MWFYLSVVAFFLLILIVCYRFRLNIIPRLPERVHAVFPQLNNYAPLSTFADQLEAGLSSNHFDIQTNIEDGDSRAGLDEQGTAEVMEIIKKQRVNFDQARLIRHNRILAMNGIDPSGMPIDSKAVTRL